MTITEEQLDAQLRALARPTPGIDPDAALALTRSASEFPSVRRRRGRWLIPTAFIAAGMLAIPTTAVASRIFEAQTGEFSEETTESEAGNALIYTGTSDYEAYLLSIAPRHLPTPAGFSWEAEAEVQSKRFENGIVEDASLIAEFEQTLWQAWVAEWIRADREGDDAARETAMAVLRAAPSWPNIASSDGGGIRLGMWSFVVGMNSSDTATRTNTAQALAQFETYRAINPFVGEKPADYPTEAEILALQGPSFKALYSLWDQQDREALINTIFDTHSPFSRHEDTSAGSPYWDDYDHALIEIATAAGVADPVAAVGHSRLGPSVWKGEVVWNGDPAADGDVE